jgi:hypothetical protein
VAALLNPALNKTGDWVAFEVQAAHRSNMITWLVSRMDFLIRCACMFNLRDR